MRILEIGVLGMSGLGLGNRGLRAAIGGLKAAPAVCVLLVPCLMFASQVLWAEKSFCGNGVGEDLAKHDYAKNAANVAKGTWHGTELGAAALGGALVWDLRDSNHWAVTCLYSIMVGVLANNGITGFNQLYKKLYPQTGVITSDQGEKSRVQKIALGAWYTAQVASGAYIGLDYWLHRAQHPISGKDKYVSILAATLLAGNGIASLKDLLLEHKKKAPTKMLVRRLRLLSKLVGRVCANKTCAQNQEQELKPVAV